MWATPFHLGLGSSKFQKFLRKAPLLQMTGESTTVAVSGKRPTCPTCSRPTRLCLCNRLPTRLHNSIPLTILQHTLEKNHPLNSARIVAIALHNLHLLNVSDVIYQAHFSIHPLQSNEVHHLFDEMPSNESDAAVATIHFTIGKQGSITSSVHCRIGPEDSKEMGFDQLLTSDLALSFLNRGFFVKKLATKLLEGSSNDYKDHQEFECKVPPGSVLLFPSKTSVEVSKINFEVKNLIVLDGTWAKAKRMYSENPWLKLLPHVNLGSDKLSLYSEVRHQPRPGYLSTIESIVFAMKAAGEKCDELDSLLDVFESMVGYQRQRKTDRLSKLMNE